MGSRLKQSLFSKGNGLLFFVESVSLCVKSIAPVASRLIKGAMQGIDIKGLTPISCLGTCLLEFRKISLVRSGALPTAADEPHRSVSR